MFRRQFYRPMQGIVGADHVDLLVDRTMASEDFGFYLLHKPGAYAFIGNGDGSERQPGQAAGSCQLHGASYDFNDALLPLGVRYWVELARSCLG